MMQSQAEDRSVAQSASADEGEPEGSWQSTDLSDLPDPPGHGRRPWVAAAAMVLAAGLLVWYLPEVTYFFRPAQPLDLGQSEAYRSRYEQDRMFDPGWPTNHFVTLSGLLGHRLTTRDGKLIFHKVAFVPVIVQAGPEAVAGRGEVIYLTATGRLRRLPQLGPYRELGEQYEQRFGIPLGHGYLLEEGHPPAAYWWAPLGALLLLLVVVSNGVLLVHRSVVQRF